VTGHLLERQAAVRLLGNWIELVHITIGLNKCQFLKFNVSDSACTMQMCMCQDSAIYLTNEK